MKSSKNLLTMRNAAKYIDNYARFRKNFKQEGIKLVESIQFSIESMEDYLHYVKSLSELKGIRVSGIRVVNAAFPSDHEDEGKSNQHTVLFIPTYCNEKGEHQAFDPLYIKDGKPMDLGELLENSGAARDEKYQNSKSKKMVAFSYSQEEESSFMNFGGMGRPPIKKD